MKPYIWTFIGILILFFVIAMMFTAIDAGL